MGGLALPVHLYHLLLVDCLLNKLNTVYGSLCRLDCVLFNSMDCPRRNKKFPAAVYFYSPVFVTFLKLLISSLDSTCMRDSSAIRFGVHSKNRDHSALHMNLPVQILPLHSAHPEIHLWPLFNQWRFPGIGGAITVHRP